MRISAIIPASGRGTRMESNVAKQYIELCGKPMLFHTVKAFQESAVDDIILVVPAGEEAYVRTQLVEPNGFSKVKKLVVGGAERYASVYNGLLAATGSDYVLIHDGARPVIDGELIARCIQAVQQHKACIAAVPVKDTIKEASNQIVEQTLDRRKLVAVQTPQCFDYSLLLNAYSTMLRRIAANRFTPSQITDDASVVEAMTSVPVKLIDGDYRNIKVTTAEDLLIAEAFLSKRNRTNSVS